MNAKKIIAIVLLVLFVLLLPLTLLTGNTGQILLKQERLTDLLVNNLLSDEALPNVIKEITIVETLHGDMDKDFDTRMLVNVLGGIRSDQWVALFDMVLPESERVALVENLLSGVFTWLGNDEAYPDVTIQVGAILGNVENNLLDITRWVFGAFRVPPCEADQVERYQAGDYGNDPQALITCTPPEEMTDDVIAATAGVIGDLLIEQAPPAEISVAEQLSAQMAPAEMQAQKALANRIKALFSLSWLFPVLFFFLAIVLVVRSRDDFIHWVQWPLFAVGLIGALIAVRIGNPAPLLQAALLPAPEAVVPPPAAALAMRMANGLFSQVSTAMLWQTLPLLLIGAGLLIYSYRENLKGIPAGLSSFFRALIPPKMEENA